MVVILIITTFAEGYSISSYPELGMIFQENRPNVSCYVTPYGQMIVGVTTDRIKINEGPDHLKIQIDYTLELNYEQTSQSHIEIDVKSKATAKLNLKEQ